MLMDLKYNPDEGLQALKQGNFNSMSQLNLPDGSTAIRLVDRKTSTVYQFRVKQLYKQGEKVLPYKQPWPQILE